MEDQALTVSASVNDDKWKDDLLCLERITGLEFIAMSAEKQAWIKKYPEVFKQSMNEDCLINTIHPRNKPRIPNFDEYRRGR